MKKERLSENEVIEGVINYFLGKGRTEVKSVLHASDAAEREHGVDLHIKLANEKGHGNQYFIEAKGNKRTDGRTMRSAFGTNFRWAISQIILRIKVDSTKNNYIYGIALPNSEMPNAVKLIRDNWALKRLKIRLYGAFRDENGRLTATEYLPSQIYT